LSGDGTPGSGTHLAGLAPAGPRPEDLRLEPTVVAGRACHVTGLTAELWPDAVLAATEHVLRGRAGEEPGR
jgi:hypothetical protein